MAENLASSSFFKEEEAEVEALLKSVLALAVSEDESRGCACRGVVLEKNLELNPPLLGLTSLNCLNRQPVLIFSAN